MRLSCFLLAAALVASATAFTPVTRARAVRHAPRTAPVMMAEAESETGVMVPVSEDNVQTTVGVAGAALGFSLGGPVFAAVAAAAANYAAKKDGEVGDITMGTGKVLLNTYNFILRTNEKLELTDKAGNALQEQLDKVKANTEGETLEQIESALVTAATKTGELYDEFEMSAKLKELLTVVGGLSSDAIDKALAYAESEGLAEKAKDKALELKDKAAAKIEQSKA